ncbi:hypothetical protein FSP39_017189 [Pinctada imbricata]|uniref:G-protein coupled receptors family 1 profile domain-containing protein n=1 Tax=Pinctada imbricata TaxID=66713 RepID=A0AA89C6X7_PINIB|nr:hypothetical protein FSP39_017189 [Pinctada imbricata]
MEAFPIWFRIVSPILFITESICGICLNLTVITSGAKRPRGSNFTILLSRVDLIMSVVVIPLTLLTVLLPPDTSFILCVIRESAMTAGTVATFATLICVSLDRYYTIVLPPNALLQSRIIKVFHILVWVFAAIGVCLPFFSLLRLPFQDARIVLSCRDHLVHLDPNNMYEFYSLLFYIMASASIIECYLAIINVARLRNQYSEQRARKGIKRGIKQNKESDFQVYICRKRTFRTIILSVMSICAVVLCWGPYIILSVVVVFTGTSPVLNILKTTACLLALSSVIWNPLLYSFLPKESGRVNTIRHTPNYKRPATTCAKSETDNEAALEQRTKPMTLLSPPIWVSPMPSASSSSTLFPSSSSFPTSSSSLKPQGSASPMPSTSTELSFMNTSSSFQEVEIHKTDCTTVSYIAVQEYRHKSTEI